MSDVSEQAKALARAVWPYVERHSKWHTYPAQRAIGAGNFAARVYGDGKISEAELALDDGGKKPGEFILDAEQESALAQTLAFLTAEDKKKLGARTLLFIPDFDRAVAQALGVTVEEAPVGFASHFGMDRNQAYFDARLLRLAPREIARHIRHELREPSRILARLSAEASLVEAEGLPYTPAQVRQLIANEEHIRLRYEEISDQLAQQYEAFRASGAEGPFIVYLKGSPKSGKSTLADSLETGLQGLGVSARTVGEFKGEHSNQRWESFDEIKNLYPKADVIIYESIQYVLDPGRKPHFLIELDVDLSRARKSRALPSLIQQSIAYIKTAPTPGHWRPDVKIDTTPSRLSNADIRK
jgi:hypothetical protein